MLGRTMTHRRRELHDRRRAAESSGTARARRRAVHRGRLAHAHAQGPFFTTVLGRLRPGVSRAAALEALHATNARLFPIWQSSYQDEKATWGMQDLKARVVGDVGSTLVFVLAAVGCVLLIACANAVNLLVARALTGAASWPFAARSARRAAGCCSTSWSKAGVLTAGAALVGARRRRRLACSS